jgi:DNA-binding NtrC family response regulator
LKSDEGNSNPIAGSGYSFPRRVVPTENDGQPIAKERHVSVVFVVDDEIVISRSLALILQHHGYSARFFTNPVEALEQIKADPPDLLISDVVMPLLSGVDLAIQAKAHHSGCEILLFSGQASTLDLLNEARELGHHFTLLTKPVHPEDLLEEINRLI